MLPYLTIPNIIIGPFTLHIWGLMVALGLFAGAYAAVFLARKRGLDPKIIWDTAPWIILWAFIGARLFHVLFYEPAYFLEHPADIIAVWNGGLSITGGLLGAVGVGIWLLKRRKVDLLAYTDVLAFGLPIGTSVGRIGCFLTHLHPGNTTNFFLGVLYPDGVVRHDIGLYLSLNGLVLFLLFLLLKNRQPPVGSFIVSYLIWYGATRFMLDFLRATDGPIVDARYLGLTPAQYVSVILFAFGLFGLWRLSHSSHTSHAKL
jgi:phosphatidylglycerol:prolipoprotein diacylglycerol transferase